MARGPRGWPSRYEREFFRDYLEQMEREERMGMHDLKERYGRYSGGPPDSYEYSERTVEHRRRAAPGPIGFTRTLGPPRPERPPRRERGRGMGPRRGRAGPGPRPRPGRGRMRPGAWDYEYGW